MTLIVLPFFTQVMVFFLLFEVAEGEESGDPEGLADADGLGDSLARGELDGVGVGDAITISAALCEAEGVGVALATATGAVVGSKFMS